MAPSAPPRPIMRIRKLADRSVGVRETRYDPITGERHLHNPATGLPEPWPLAGVAVEGDAPAECRVPTSFVDTGREEGWLTLEGERVAHRPGGPRSNPWKVTHTFVQADAVVIHTVDGDLRYRVTHQPDKYADPGDDDTPVTDDVYDAGDTRVDWFYDLVLEG